MKNAKRFLSILTAALLGVGCLPMMSVQAEDANALAVGQNEMAQPGDANLDGLTDILDVITVNKAVLGLKTLETAAQKNADKNGDGKVDAEDSLAILKQVLGIEEEIRSADHAVNLAVKYTAQPVRTTDLDEQTILGQTKFALDLLRESAEPRKNSLVSPYSVSQALGMTANGAAGNTLKEMETVLGGSMETLNPAFYTLRTRDTKDAKCLTANSIWMQDSYFTEHPVNPDFLQTNADYYGADVFTAPFDDTTLTDINNWVKDKTDNMIPEILDEIPEGAAMYLVNAVAFDAEWENPYGSSYDGKFMAADGTDQAVKMMSHDNYNRYYYETAHGVGFRENYKGGQYYFAAFLPEAGMTPEEYLAGMTAEELHETLQNPKKGRVYSTLPKFTYDFDIELSKPLRTMGMPSAFLEGPESDFSRVRADHFDNLYINRVLHKTHIEVSELGTRAGAATAVELCIESAADAYMTFNRPFLYMIADSETNLPVFIGIVNSVQ